MSMVEMARGQDPYRGVRFVRQGETWWCWAACIENLFRFHGFDVRQATIVNKAYGISLGSFYPNVGAALEAAGSRRLEGDFEVRSLDEILRKFTQGIDDHHLAHEEFRTTAHRFGTKDQRPEWSLLLNRCATTPPLLLWLDGLPAAHAVLCLEADGNGAIVHDPALKSGGIQRRARPELEPRLVAFWDLEVRTPGEG